MSIVSKAEHGHVSVFSSLKLSKEHNTAVNAGEHMHINEFQDMMKRLYFHRDTERGVKGTYDWLVDELGELGEALEGKDLEALEEEFADVIAWLASLANVTGINLERAATNKYRDRCPKCEKAPCQCSF